MPVNNDERIWGDDYTLPSAMQIKTTSVDWLWPGRIAFNQLTIIEGDPGVGKSMLTAAIAAAVTGGPPLPGMPQLPPFPCIIANLEDDPAGITIPRLRAAGADLDRIYLPQMGDSHNARLLSLPDDLNRIWQMLEITDARLLVIDPLMAALSPDVNSDNDQQVRRVLNDLVQAANLRKAAVVIVRHLNKQAGRRAIYRGGGSIGIAAAARSVLLLSRDPASRGLLLSSTKQNLAAQPLDDCAPHRSRKRRQPHRMGRRTCSHVRGSAQSICRPGASWRRRDGQRLAGGQSLRYGTPRPGCARGVGSGRDSGGDSAAGGPPGWR